ncbi:MAG: pyridoxal phosphate-dependent aminotransferase [Blastocatellia bacterium]|nr:pyridoxal phosphate-dependent aminotransferase [Blastocatellia bacterium]MBL8194246.1 pyridoxal phosphate-dependent aminotransferase [Blastocatellia bacterium]MBN8722370.1 pyridoxal phosphate-dependent aminotransferase [Acidobacteriota bacterium]
MSSSISKFVPSTRVAKMSASSTLAVLQKADSLRRAGYDVIDLGAGEPDFNTPEHIKQAAHQAITDNFTRYTPAAGTKEIKDAIIKYFSQETNTEYHPSEIVVSAGGKQAIFNAILTLINPGDEVLLPAPYWVTFPEIVTLAQGKTVIIDTEINNFQLTKEMVANYISPRTKLLILNSPSNPSGRVIDQKEFVAIAELAAKNNIWLLSDECYYQFVYPPERPFSAASLREDLRANTLICGSFSKTYAMTGWRLGYALGPKDWIAEMVKVQSHSTSNPSSIGQKAAIAALVSPQDSVVEMLAEYKKRRDYLIPALNSIAGFECVEPEGAFYAFPNIKKVLASNEKIKTSDALAEYLLTQAHVALTAGSAFGSEGYLRISYATSLDILKRAIERINACVEKLIK